MKPFLVTLFFMLISLPLCGQDLNLTSDIRYYTVEKSFYGTDADIEKLESVKPDGIDDNTILKFRPDDNILTVYIGNEDFLSFYVNQSEYLQQHIKFDQDGYRRSVNCVDNYGDRVVITYFRIDEDHEYLRIRYSDSETQETLFKISPLTLVGI